MPQRIPGRAPSVFPSPFVSPPASVPYEARSPRRSDTSTVPFPSMSAHGAAWSRRRVAAADRKQMSERDSPGEGRLCARRAECGPPRPSPGAGRGWARGKKGRGATRRAKQGRQRHAQHNTHGAARRPRAKPMEKQVPEEEYGRWGDANVLRGSSPLLETPTKPRRRVKPRMVVLAGERDTERLLRERHACDAEPERAQNSV